MLTLTCVGMMLFALQEDPAKEKDKDLEQLREVLNHVLELTQMEKADVLKKIVASWKIKQEEFSKLFGEEATKQAYEKYAEFWKDVDQEAAQDLVNRSRKNQWEEVDVWCVNAADPKEVSGNEKTVVDSLVDKKTKVYSARFRKKGEKEGYTLVCFVKVGDNWRAGLKVGRFLKSDEKGKGDK